MPPGAHRAYNEWHQLDHLPEQMAIPGVAQAATRIVAASDVQRDGITHGVLPQSVANRVGTLATRRFGWREDNPYTVTITGVVLLMLPVSLT